MNPILEFLESLYKEGRKIEPHKTYGLLPYENIELIMKDFLKSQNVYILEKDNQNERT